MYVDQECVGDESEGKKDKPDQRYQDGIVDAVEEIREEIEQNDRDARERDYQNSK
jgi:hypothetical protein